MTFSIVGTPTTVANGPNNISVSKPTGVATGDLIVILADTESASGAASSSGFTALGDKPSTLQAFRSTLLYKVAGASEPASYTITGGAGCSYVEAMCVAVRSSTGLATTPIEASSSNANTSNSTAASAPSITTTAADELLFFAVNWNGSESFSAPTGFTALISDLPDGLYCFSQAQASAGATGTVNSTLAASDAWVTWLIAIAPAGSGGGTTINGTANPSQPSGVTLSAAASLSIASTANASQPGGTTPAPAASLTIAATANAPHSGATTPTASASLATAATANPVSQAGATISSAVASLSEGAVSVASMAGGVTPSAAGALVIAATAHAASAAGATLPSAVATVNSGSTLNATANPIAGAGATLPSASALVAIAATPTAVQLAGATLPSASASTTEAGIPIPAIAGGVTPSAVASLTIAATANAAASCGATLPSAAGSISLNGVINGTANPVQAGATLPSAQAGVSIFVLRSGASLLIAAQPSPVAQAGALLPANAPDVNMTQTHTADNPSDGGGGYLPSASGSTFYGTQINATAYSIVGGALLPARLATTSVGYAFLPDATADVTRDGANETIVIVPARYSIVGAG